MLDSPESATLAVTIIPVSSKGGVRTRGRRENFEWPGGAVNIMRLGGTADSFIWLGGRRKTSTWLAGAARKLLSGRVGRKVGGKLHVAERRKASCSCGWAGGGKFRVAGRGGKLRVAGRDGKRHVAGRAEENVEWLGGVAENFEWPVGKLRRWGGERTSRRGGWGQSHGGGAAENFTSKAEGGEPRANRAHCIICVDFNTAARASTPSQPARARAPPAGSAPSAGLPTLQQKK